MLKQIHKLSGGFTLIEIMVALLIVSIGLLGVATLQIKGYQFNHTAYSRTQAIFLAYDIMERMRVNANAARSGAYNSECKEVEEGDCDDDDCTPPQLATYDLAKWCESLQNTLKGEVDASIQGDISNNFTITIKWRKAGETEAQGEEQIWTLQL
jgi:type IV pilus assembly protein PilV